MTSAIYNYPSRLSYLIFMGIALTIGGLGFLFSNAGFATAAFEVLFVYFCVTSLLVEKRISRKVGFFIVASTAYLVYGYTYSVVINKDNVLDFLMAFKAYYYVILLCLITKKSLFKPNQIKKIFYALSLMFLAKYTLSRLIQGDARPTVYTENNFELILLICLYYLKSIKCNTRNYKELFLLLLIVLISGSRSSVLALVIVAASMHITKLNMKLVINSVILIFISAVAVFLFMSRMGGGGIESIDRYKFLLLFLGELQNMPWWRVFIGEPPITPLSPFTCYQLAYYESLFSQNQDGSCYSVIFHSYIMRSIFDHGLIGLSFLLVFVHKALRTSSYTMRQALTVNSIFLITGLSVSSFNNVYVALSLLFFLASFQKTKLTKSNVINRNPAISAGNYQTQNIQ